MPYKDIAQKQAYQRAWLLARKTRWLLANGPCKQCGSWVDLEVDHIDPEKKVSHRIWSWSQQRRDEELKKCQVLCADCHRGVDGKSGKECAALFTKPLVHGTYSGYLKKGCRCTECTTVYLSYWKEHNRKRRARS